MAKDNKDTYIVFGEGTSDENLAEKIQSWLKESQTYHDYLLTRQNKSVEYYHGNQTDARLVQPHNSDSVYNRIFEAIETITPIVTGSAHQFIAMPAEENEISLARSQRVQRVLSKKYEDLEIRRKLENVSRDMMLKRFGVLEYGWDIETDDIGVWVRDPRTILIPKLRVDPHDLPYVMKIAEFDEDDIRTYFPDADTTKLVTGESIKVAQNQAVSSAENLVYQVLVTYTNEYWTWSQNDVILKKMVNPYWDFEGSEVEEIDTEQAGKVKTRTTSIFKNHLNRPEKPFIFFTPFTTGEAPIAETCLTEIAMPIQDDINISKRQILDNLRRMGNGQIYIDADALPEEVAEAITNEPGLILIGKNLASENRIRREPAVQIPASHFSNLVDSIQAFDNVFGTHGALRGQSDSETLGGQILDRQQNLSRIEQLTRELNRGVARLVDGLVQLMKMYYTDEKAFKFLGNDGAVQFMTFINDDIEDGVVIETRSGNAPSLDPLARYNQAIQLWQLNALDPETLFEKLEFADPQMTAQKLAAWKAGQLVFESQIRQQEGAAAAAAKAEADVAGAGADTQDRDVETSNDVIARAEEAQSGGGKAPLSNTPNQ